MTYRQRADAILGLSAVCFLAILAWWYTHPAGVREALLFFCYSIGTYRQYCGLVCRDGII